MAMGEGDIKLLTLERVGQEPIRQPLGAGQHRDIELALTQFVDQIMRAGFDQTDAYVGVSSVEIGKKAGEAGRPDGAHDADGDLGLFQRQETLGGVARVVRLVADAFQPRPNRRSQIGDVGEIGLPPEQKPAYLVFKLLDGATEGRLADMALLCSSGEVEGFADGEEVFHVMHVHAGSLGLVMTRCPMTFRHGIEAQPASAASKP
jgi:hypothetical protein